MSGDSVDDVTDEMSEYEPDGYRDLLPEGTPESLTIPITFDMMRAAVLLRRRLPRQQYDRLFESIVHLASEELEVDSTLVELEAKRIEAERQPSLFADDAGGDASE